MSDEKSESTLGARLIIAIVLALLGRSYFNDLMSKESLDFITGICAAVGFFYELIIFFIIIVLVFSFLK